MLNFKREQGIEQAKQLVLENLNPTLQEKLHVTQSRVETFLSRDKQVFWNLTKNILKINKKYLTNKALICIIVKVSLKRGYYDN